MASRNIRSFEDRHFHDVENENVTGNRYENGEKENQNDFRKLSEHDLDRFDNATHEDPVFIEGTLLSGFYEDMFPSWKGAFAVTGRRESDDYGEEDHYSLYAIRVDEPFSSENRSHPLEVGDFLTRSAGELAQMEIVDTPELDKAYRDMVERRENAPYIVESVLYSDQPTSYMFGKYPVYSEIPGSEKTWNLKDERLKDGSPIRSLDDAARWLCENEPAYLVGAGMRQDCPSGDIQFKCVPTAYGEGNYETVENRWSYAKREAERLGVTMGNKTWDMALTECLGDKKEEVLQNIERLQEEAKATRVVEPPRKPRALPDLSGIRGFGDDNKKDIEASSYMDDLDF